MERRVKIPPLPMRHWVTPGEALSYATVIVPVALAVLGVIYG